MSDFLDLPVPLLLLLCLSLAGGVDFFLTLLVLELTFGLGWPGIRETGLPPLQWTVLAGFAALYLIEAFAELRPVPASIWHNLQLFMRPLGGFLLALTLLDGFPLSVQLPAAVGAGVVCAFTHVLSWGQKLLTYLNPDGRISITTRVLAEDTLVLAFLVMAVEHPDWGFVLSAFLLLLGLILGGSMHHAVRFGLSLLTSRLSGLLRRPGWRGTAELPHWIDVAGEGEGGSGLRGLPAGMSSIPGPGGFREGWLLERGQVREFAFRRQGTPTVIPLNAFSVGEAEGVALARRYPLAGKEGSRAALFLQGNSPSLESHK